MSPRKLSGLRGKKGLPHQSLIHSHEFGNAGGLGGVVEVNGCACLNLVDSIPPQHLNELPYKM